MFAEVDVSNRCFISLNFLQLNLGRLRSKLQYLKISSFFPVLSSSVFSFTCCNQAISSSKLEIKILELSFIALYELVGHVLK